MESKTGSVLSLIGGILWLVISIALIVAALVAVIMSADSESNGIILGVILLVIGVLFVIYGALGVKAGKWMKEKSTVKKGGLTALIVGILGLNILTIIGGILGLADSKKG
ncbi:hypothetical protein A3K73_06055 [Candidatus Pacearchaeota archaeon RBG_13_36_9]|nr:MAG: hypothetical protein A3K73_06055 [Candidatus Pacearchaeota archaeon RBG_13_36_9]